MIHLLLALAFCSRLGLDAPITVRSEAGTVGSVLESVSSQTGQKIEIAPGLSGDRIVLYAENTPAREILDRIAKHLGWTWQHEGDTLRLMQTPLQRRNEEQNAVKELLHPYHVWQAISIAAVNAKASPTDRQDYEDALEVSRRLSDRYQSEYFGSDPAVRAKWVKEDYANETLTAKLARRLSLGYKIYDWIVAGLTDQELLDLDRTSKLVFSFNPTSWQRKLPGEAKGIAEEYVKQISNYSKIDPQTWDPNDGKRALLVSAMGAFEASDVATLRVTIKAGRLPQPSELFAPSTKITLLDKQGRILAEPQPTSWMGPGRPSKATPIERPKDRFDENIVPTDDLTEAAKPSVSNRYLLASSSEYLERFLKIGSKTIPAEAEAKLLIELARAAHINIISDVYDLQGWLYSRAFPLTTDRSVLDQVARELGANWGFDSNWVTLRSDNWEYKRSITLAPKELFELRDLLIVDSSFDSLAEAALKLSDRQTMSPLVSTLLTKFANWESYDTDQRHLCLLRFWGRLNSTTRKSLLSGQMIPIASLTEAQQQEISAFVYRQDDHLYNSMIFGAIAGDIEKPEVERMKQYWPGYPVSGDVRRDLEPTQRLPDGVPQGALVGARASQANALVVSNGKGWSMPMTEEMAVVSGYYDPKSAEYSAKLAVQDRMFFTVLFGPTSALGFELGKVNATPGAEAMKYSDLPEEVRTRLDQAYKARHGGY